MNNTFSTVIKRIGILLYTLATFLWASIQSGKVSIPVVLNTSVNSLLLLKTTNKYGMDIGKLNHRNIMWLAYLANLNRPCGIIHNVTDTIVWVNNCSSLKVGGKTTESFLDKDKLSMLRDVIDNLRDVDVANREDSFFEMHYLLRLRENTKEITDRFYKMSVGDETFRIFEQLSERTIN